MLFLKLSVCLGLVTLGFRGLDWLFDRVTLTTPPPGTVVDLTTASQAVAVTANSEFLQCLRVVDPGAPSTGARDSAPRNLDELWPELTRLSTPPAVVLSARRGTANLSWWDPAGPMVDSTGLAIEETEPSLQIVDIRMRNPHSICGVCGEGVAGAHVLCGHCDAPHHEDCWTYNRCCSTYGCRSAMAVSSRRCAA